MVRFSSVRRWYFGTPGGDFDFAFGAMLYLLAFFVAGKYKAYVGFFNAKMRIAHLPDA